MIGGIEDRENPIQNRGAQMLLTLYPDVKDCKAEKVSIIIYVPTHMILCTSTLILNKDLYDIMYFI